MVALEVVSCVKARWAVLLSLPRGYQSPSYKTYWLPNTIKNFNEKSDDVCLSREDQKVMQIMKSSIQLDEGHYCFDLPFKAEDSVLPNNNSIAEQHLLSLHRKFKSNKDYHQVYTAFLSKVIKKGYAELLPHQQLKQDDGKVWYMPQYGVYHPKKKTLRVLFDCAAVFKRNFIEFTAVAGALPHKHLSWSTYQV